jgi:hypothetical protein
MSDTSSGQAEPAAEAQPPPPSFTPAAGFPPVGLPTVFADLLLNVSPTPTTVRFYLGRNEPDVGGVNRFRNVPVAQIVMPTDGFVGMVVFLQGALETFVNSGAISQELVDALRKQLSQPASSPADK